MERLWAATLGRLPPPDLQRELLCGAGGDVADRSAAATGSETLGAPYVVLIIDLDPELTVQQIDKVKRQVSKLFSRERCVRLDGPQARFPICATLVWAYAVVRVQACQQHVRRGTQAPQAKRRGTQAPHKVGRQLQCGAFQRLGSAPPPLAWPAAR